MKLTRMFCNTFRLMNLCLDEVTAHRLDACGTLQSRTGTGDQGMGHQVRSRRLVRALLAILLAFATAGAARAQGNTTRYSSILIDARTGKILMGENLDELRYPASLTKLMTLYMTFEALRDRRIQLTQDVPVSAWAAEQPPSKIGLQPGEVLTVEQAILGIVTKSGNDAAAALGEFLGGSEDRFAQMMTLRARALGMSRTNFRNASGLPDPNQWTTARDLATLGRRLVLDFPQLYGYFGVPGFVWHNRVILNHDSMLKTYPGADGMKTGYTNFAGHNLVTSAVRGNVRLIGVVMGTNSNAQRDQSMAMLLDDGFNQMNAPSFRFGGGLMGVANAATTLSVHSGSAHFGQGAAEPVRSLVMPRVVHDRAVQIGTFQGESIAREVAQEAAGLAPGGVARVQPVIFGRRTLYHAQLLGLSEAEARMVCANQPRRGPSCQVFRIGTGQTALR
jgi:D-alanyl-D-alanine carboxypeptidase